jgi:hypothetical protein
MQKFFAGQRLVSVLIVKVNEALIHKNGFIFLKLQRLYHQKRIAGDESTKIPCTLVNKNFCMYKKILLPILTITFIACNNSTDKSSASSDSTDKKMSTDTMSNMATTATVPELPAVPEGAKVYFKNLKNGALVTSPVKVMMAVDNMKVDTAGPVVVASGHYHIFIDAQDSLSSGTMVPKDSTHLHYGKGQTEAEVKLAPGVHKLTLQFADGLHRSYGSKLATTVSVNVKK